MVIRSVFHLISDCLDIISANLIHVSFNKPVNFHRLLVSIECIIIHWFLLHKNLQNIPLNPFTKRPRSTHQLILLCWLILILKVTLHSTTPQQNYITCQVLNDKILNKHHSKIWHKQKFVISNSKFRIENNKFENPMKTNLETSPPHKWCLQKNVWINPFCNKFIYSMIHG
jgi:hypothetical protein